MSLGHDPWEDFVAVFGFPIIAAIVVVVVCWFIHTA